MAPKKKGKKSSKDRVDESPEERLARAEKEAYEAEERERSRTQNARRALVERQAREERYARLNGIKIHNQWRKIMRMAKVDELRRDIEILSQNHEREVDRKDAIIQMLDRDSEDADEQLDLVVRAHIRVTDQLMDLQYQRMVSIQEQFRRQVKALESEFEAERAEIAAAHARHTKDLNDIMDAMSAEFQESENDLRQEFEAQREEIRNKNSEDYNVLKISLESSISELEKYFEQAHMAYLQSTEQHTNTFRELTKNDAQAAQVIEMRMRKLRWLQESLKTWRNKAKSSSCEWEERNRSMLNEKKMMNGHYQSLKLSLDTFRQQQAERLKQLSMQAGACLTELSAKIERAEGILKLAEMCRKLETEQEKIIPFHSVSEAVRLEGEASALQDVVAAEQPAKVTAAAKPAAACQGVDTDGRAIEEWDYLNNFFRRHNKALLDKAAVEREAARLEAENGDLRAILKQYLDGISVNEAVLNNPANPLVVVNNRLQLTLEERNRVRQAALQQQVVEQVALTG